MPVVEKFRVTFPLGSRDFCLLLNVQTDSSAHTVCYLVGQFSGSTVAEAWNRLKSIYFPEMSDITMKIQVSTANFRPEIRMQYLRQQSRN
jgi:hypothetical protein